MNNVSFFHLIHGPYYRQQQEPKPNNPRDEFPDAIDYGALPPDEFLIPTTVKIRQPTIIDVQAEQNSPLRGNSHLPGRNGGRVHGHQAGASPKISQPPCPMIWNAYSRQQWVLRTNLPNTPPVIQPPVIQPPVIQPPVIQPPVIQPESSGTVIKRGSSTVIKRGSSDSSDSTTWAL